MENSAINSFLNASLQNIILIQFFKIILFAYSFIYLFGWALSSSLRVGSLVAVSRFYSSLGCTAFPSLWLLLLWGTGSRHTGFSSCSLQALEYGVSSWGALAYQNLPRPGIETVSPGRQILIHCTTREVSILTAVHWFHFNFYIVNSERS